jgi:hypothetical protein
MKLKVSVALNVLLLVVVGTLAAQNICFHIERGIRDHYFPERKLNFENLVAGHLRLNGEGEKTSDVVFNYQLSPLPRLSLGHGE